MADFIILHKCSLKYDEKSNYFDREAYELPGKWLITL